jgi:hypothetical protein
LNREFLPDNQAEIDEDEQVHLKTLCLRAKADEQQFKSQGPASGSVDNGKYVHQAVKNLDFIADAVANLFVSRYLFIDIGRKIYLDRF